MWRVAVVTRSCFAEVSEFLVFTSQHSIRAVPLSHLESITSSTEAIEPIISNGTFVALDYDVADNYLYYSEVRKDIVWRKRPNSPGKVLSKKKSFIIFLKR